MVTTKTHRDDANEKLRLLGKLAGASARIIRQIPQMDISSNQFSSLRVIVEKLGDIATELER